jgi:hypothetical protein
VGRRNWLAGAKGRIAEERGNGRQRKGKAEREEEGRTEKVERDELGPTEEERSANLVCAWMFCFSYGRRASMRKRFLFRGFYLLTLFTVIEFLKHLYPFSS